MLLLRAVTGFYPHSANNFDSIPTSDRNSSAYIITSNSLLVARLMSAEINNILFYYTTIILEKDKATLLNRCLVDV